jgi:enoyl-CoA hydratase/carnithine racemase
VENSTVATATAGAVRRLTLTRPERLNAFTAGMYRDLRVALDRATSDADVRAVVVTGAGRAFSAGADRSLVDGTATDEERALVTEEFTGMLDALGGCPKPVVAAVNGVAVGIGCTMLLHCDLVVVAESARLRMPFTALGVLPEAGSSVLLPLRARWHDAAWAMLSSEWIDAPAAVAMGLAWRVVPDGAVVDEAHAAADAIAAHDPHVVEATKRLLTEGRAELVRAAIERELGEARALRA